MDLLISDSAFALVHSPHGLAGEVRGRLVVVKRIDGCDFVRTRTDVCIDLCLFKFLGFRLRPGNATRLDLCLTGVILARSNFILFLSFKILNRRLIQLQLTSLILIVAVSMDIGRNGGDGLILIDVDEMLEYFGFCCGVGADGFRSDF